MDRIYNQTIEYYVNNINGRYSLFDEYLTFPMTLNDLKSIGKHLFFNKMVILVYKFTFQCFFLVKNVW